ncbi:hypothetical protein EH31_12480 [Erythrobacter longus]|uniref:BLUF domain-containing protein n=1 Tax=Erythrobacter longus TaxID=1044 RepID=A0A074M9K4_ERYLO|nr:BLUF domain-containing protein [Erythrobacter longus]KEO89455.1 hypothetical protein EH31_12480 [Erythrobacter longus]
MISQYVYISTAQGLSRDQVQAILDSCARNNVEHGVTGLLLYNGRNFLQLLEGDKVAVDQLMTIIEKDPRHAGLAILHKGEVDARVCPDWAMKWIAISDAFDLRQERLEEDLPKAVDPAIHKIVMNFAMLN